MTVCVGGGNRGVYRDDTWLCVSERVIEGYTGVTLHCVCVGEGNRGVYSGDTSLCVCVGEGNRGVYRVDTSLCVCRRG